MDTASSAVAPPESWPVLDLHERRVLGVLIEKAKTTPDAYPLSLNALVTGCNQKSNRDPVLNLSDAEVEQALAALQKNGLAVRLTGSGRVERWRHVAYEAWKVDKVDLAVLAELLLRGAQTEGELRGRASRMEPIDDLDKLREVLKTLTERKLVLYLTPEGRRGTVLTHGFQTAADIERQRARQANSGIAATSEEPMLRAVTADVAAEWQKTQDEIGALKAKVNELENKMTELAEQFQELKAGLGG
jgi:uncharacterized protein YceH (UPF0502 family)